jgi:hypothetical protein
MPLRHSQVLHRVALEVEFDEDGGFVADYTAVVSGFYGDELRRDEILFATILELDLYVASGEESDVGVHAALGAGDWLHVLGPMKTGRVDDAFHASAAHTRDIHLDVSKVFAFGSLHWRE